MNIILALIWYSSLRNLLLDVHFKEQIDRKRQQKRWLVMFTWGQLPPTWALKERKSVRWEFYVTHFKKVHGHLYKTTNLWTWTLGKLWSPPPYSLWSLVSSSAKFFSYAGPASTKPPLALREKNRPKRQLDDKGCDCKQNRSASYTKKTLSLTRSLRNTRGSNAGIASGSGPVELRVQENKNYFPFIHRNSNYDHAPLA